MLHLLSVMGYAFETGTYTSLFFYYNTRLRHMSAMFNELAEKLERFVLRIPDGNALIKTAQFRVIQKLCSIRLLQLQWNVPLDVISEYVVLKV